MRDENGFKMHTQSESHVRQMLVVGENSKKFIQDYSNQFQRDFLQLLRTSHGEKRTHLNHFYQEYISNKEHVHMNATRWPSLMEFAKYLGREGICRVDEDEKGVFVSWIDNSPENLRRQDAVRRKERQDRGDEEREQAAIREQIKRAKADRGEDEDDQQEDVARELKRDEGEKIKLNFGSRAAPKENDSSTPPAQSKDMVGDDEAAVSGAPTKDQDVAQVDEEKGAVTDNTLSVPAPEAASPKVAVKMGMSSKPKNVFAAAKKNVLGGKKTAIIEQPKKMSEAERIMREEMERKKRGPPGFGGPAQKKQKF